MRKVFPNFMVVLVLLYSNVVDGQQYKPKLLRFDEDYSNLTDSVVQKKPWLRTKNISLNQTTTIKVSVGLDYREMYELVKGYDSTGATDGYWLTRIMAHADVHFGTRFRTFFQVGRGFIAARVLPARPVDVDELFFLNAFGEYHFGKQNNNYLRLGRQELFFGLGRLIAPREGPNLRSTYDGVRVHNSMGAFTWDAFFSYLVNNKQGILDNEILGNNQRLWGFYSTKKWRQFSADLYYLGYYNPTALFSKQVTRAKETRHSMGVRWYGKVSNGTGYDAEAVYQFGQFGSNSIDAFMVDAKVSKDIQLKRSVLKPSAKIGYFSGNRSVNDSKLTTYNSLFPNLLYYQTAIGIFPSNLINPQVNLGWDYKKLSIVGGVDGYWRASKQDGLYAPFGTLLLNNTNETYLGYQLYTKADYAFTQNLSCTFLVSRYYKSQFIKNNTDGRGIDLLVNILLNYKL
ncbi:MAG: alginate export family protein [Rhizobacter sp.]|nr:alginate export family protein [Ferruginibacter sp.]